ncbi:Uncharacterised protein [Porphyromonas macacae]|uniref:Outer membrane protein beta-barrel domain-containing protein n=2 Tax=Porphyromonas macacae TaxID=28115 RepID=A0A379EAG2_9PORP|nr:carboxypeptidase-like regulatory domain-containing protein [Porphyromonas macacae]SUB89688.1 Uncharacterised protein [Porphyromonas macacae]
MRYLLFSLTLLFFSISLFSQTEIRGKVVDNKQHKPIISATVTLHPVKANTILTYDMTDEKGDFVLKKAGLPDSVVIAVRSINSEPYRKKIKSDIKYIEINVNEQTIDLKEVIVKAPKIHQKGDTINYSVASYINATDRSIGDVLKKLPGVQVLSSGQILYQNKVISKFYIEGMDLLKGKYGIATKNIDASKVASVQVLENHQPIKALKDMELPEEAAINLRLKKSSKGAFFATAQAGLGLPLWLYNNELAGMRFTHNQQNIVVLKDDNTGRDISQELTSFYNQARNSGVNFLSVSSLSRPHINEQHYLFNRSNIVSFNNLIVLDKDATLIGNLNFLHDKQTQNGYSERQVFLADNKKIKIVEDAENRFLKRELEGSLVWEVNKENKYIHNKIKAVGKWNEITGTLLPASSSRNNQFLKTPNVNVSNDFEYLFKRDKRQYRLGGFAGYVNQPTHLTVSPSLIGKLIASNATTDPVMRQDVNYSHFSSNTFFSGGYGEKFNISYKVEAFTNIYRLRSNMYNDFDHQNMFEADSLQNHLSRNEFGGKFTAKIFRKFSQRLSMNLSLPLEFLFVKKKDNYHQLNENKSYTFFSPYFNLFLGLSPRTTMSIALKYNQNIGGITEDYMGYIMSNYKSMYRSGIMQSKSRNSYTGFSLRYRDPFTTLFASLYLTYNNRWSNILRNFRYNGIFSSEDGIYRPNTSNSFMSSFALGKIIDAIRSDVQLTVSYNYLDGLTLNQEKISPFKTDLWNISPSITTDATKWMIMKYEAAYTQSVHAIYRERLPTIHALRQKITTALIPVKKLVLSLSVNHYYNSLLSEESKSVWFGNIDLKYKMKDADIIVDWNNIFNIKQFVTSSYNSTMSHYSKYELRPSELLVRVRFKLF